MDKVEEKIKQLLKKLKEKAKKIYEAIREVWGEADNEYVVNPLAPETF